MESQFFSPDRLPEEVLLRTHTKEYWDKLVYKMKEMNLSVPEQSAIKQDIFHQEALFNREKRTKLSPKDFKPINIIGRGAFGEVRLCRWRDRND